MKKRTVSLFFLLTITFFTNCDGSSDDKSTILALLMNKKCINLPKIIVVVDLSSGSSIATFNCSVSDRQYICSDGNSVQYRTFSSVEGALLGVVNPPGGGGFGFFPSQRGLLRNKATSVSNPNNVLYNFTYTYDPSHRLVSATDEINSTSRSYGDYDLNGFPLDVDGSSANYSYDSGRKRPKSISVSGGPGILFDSKGWAIEFAEGLDSIAFENSGSLQICD